MLNYIVKLLFVYKKIKEFKAFLKDARIPDIQ